MTHASSGPLVFIGTYTRTGSRGVYVHRFDADSGALEPASAASEAENPSFLALHPNRRFLYAASEIGEFEGRAQGALYAYAIDAESARLDFINRRGSGGQGPCHVSVDSTGSFLLAANYQGGSVCALPIAEDGSLEPASDFIQHTGSSVNPDRQEQAHAHSINLDARDRFAYVPDLGQDRVIIYRLDAERGMLLANDPAHVRVDAGFGPRHFTFDPSGSRAYVINELASTITAFGCDVDTGALAEIQTVSTLPSDFSGSNTTADIHIHPSGRFLYGSNRGHDSIAVFEVEANTGRLAAMGHESTRGQTPRNFAIDPSGRFLLAANQDSDSIVTFSIDPDSGRLGSTCHAAEIPMPVCVRFLDE